MLRLRLVSRDPARGSSRNSVSIRFPRKSMVYLPLFGLPPFLRARLWPLRRYRFRLVPDPNLHDTLHTLLHKPQQNVDANREGTYWPLPAKSVANFFALEGASGGCEALFALFVDVTKAGASPRNIQFERKLSDKPFAGVSDGMAVTLNSKRTALCLLFSQYLLCEFRSRAPSCVQLRVTFVNQTSCRYHMGNRLHPRPFSPWLPPAAAAATYLYQLDDVLP